MPGKVLSTSIGQILFIIKWGRLKPCLPRYWNIKNFNLIISWPYTDGVLFGCCFFIVHVFTIVYTFIFSSWQISSYSSWLSPSKLMIHKYRELNSFQSKTGIFNIDYIFYIFLTYICVFIPILFRQHKELHWPLPPLRTTVLCSRKPDTQINLHTSWDYIMY